MHFADRLIAWLTASGAAAPAAIFALVFAESGLMLAIPGETAVLIGGALAATGQISLLVLTLVAVVGALSGDAVGYLLGRGPGRRRYFATGRFLLLRERHVRRVEDLLQRRGTPIVLATRFLPIVRIAGPFVFGLVGLRPSRFFPLILISDIVWGIAFSALGYAIGDAWAQLHVWMGRAGLVLVAIAAGVAWFLWRRSRRRGTTGGDDPKPEDHPQG
jgi:membrane protein DedA with SNARE-associated domain